ncbi:LuxR C-terminal-related transcriptional regulator [Streptomyces sp. NPDC059894]|uniref:LuxR C-terminal-related transcriptional regulator n=1 Tax=unclassified Streptomyces TaxID=2593676 RepID=UPI00365CC1E5
MGGALGAGGGAVVRVRADPALAAVPGSGLRTLLRALGEVTGRVPTGASGGALLDVLRATGTPLLVCVDDAHLWDATSRAALGHAAARLTGTADVSLLLSIPGHRPPDPEFAGLPPLRLDPLSPEAAAALVDEATGGTVDAGVRDEVVDAAEGNPALLLAVVRRLSPAQLRGERRLPLPLADGDVLTGLAGGLLSGATPEQRDVLLTVAAAVRDAGGAGYAGGVEQAATAGGSPAGAVAPEHPAVDVGLLLRAVEHLRDGGPPASPGHPLPDLLTENDGEVRFRSELLRRTVYEGAPAERRRAVHRALARAWEGADPALRTLLHRAWAGAGTAAELAAAAADPAGSAPRGLRCAAYTRAAELTDDIAQRAEWYLAAAEQALLAGRRHQGARLLDAARTGGAPALVRGRAELLRGTTLLHDGPVDEAGASLLLATSLLAGRAPEQAARAALGASDAAWAAGDPAGCLRALGRSEDAVAGTDAVAGADAAAGTGVAAGTGAAAGTDVSAGTDVATGTNTAAGTDVSAGTELAGTGAAEVTGVADGTGAASEGLAAVKRSAPVEPSAAVERSAATEACEASAAPEVTAAAETNATNAANAAAEESEANEENDDSDDSAESAESEESAVAAVDAPLRNGEPVRDSAAVERAAAVRAGLAVARGATPGKTATVGERSAPVTTGTVGRSGSPPADTVAGARSAAGTSTASSSRDGGVAAGATVAGGTAPEVRRTAAERGVALAHDYRRGLLALLEGDFPAAAEPLRRVLERAEGGDEPEDALRAAGAALMLGELDAGRRAGTRALAAARTLGTVPAVLRAREYLAYVELRAGRHALARTHAEEGLRAAQAARQRNTAAHHHAVLALAASIEGETDLVAGHVAAALTTARRHGLAQATTLAEWAAARADLARGRPREAADRLGPLVRPGPRRGHFAVWMLAVPCFVEAAASAGQPDGARAAVEDFALWAEFGADPQAPALLLRCRALLAPPDRADALYRHALDLHEAAGGDFERARTELLHGKWLRRRRRLGEARDRLGAALVGFERCGARAWAEQTRGELRANGASPGGARAGAGLSLLTPQQLRIARCVAEGATNREVALTLSVSTRTVDYHLRKVFAALGVRSRLELARMVEQAEKSGAHP